MQASGSFELARNGRKRPSNLLKTRDSASEFPCYSPSFNPAHSSRSSPRHADGLPPTPVTAGIPKDQLEDRDQQSIQSSESQRSPISLPSIDHMLLSAPSAASSLLTPPASGRMGSLAPLIGSDSSDDHDEGRFPGPPPAWLQDSEQSSFVGVRPPISRQPSSESRYSTWSPRAFDGLAQEEESQGVVGLGFGMSDATPRIGCFGSNALGLHTPTQSSYSRAQQVPSAPSLAQEGRFESTLPSSPISPPLRNWNTDLRRSAPRPSAHIGVARPRPTSIAMQREQPVTIEGGVPKQTGVFGLGVSLSGNMSGDFTRAPEEQRIATTPATRLDGPSVSPVGSSAAAADKFRDLAAATGLTPTLSMARIQDIENNPLASPSSPSLRARSKKRSDMVRRQAEAAVFAGLVTREPIAPSSDSSTPPTSELSDTTGGRSNSNVSAEQLSSPRKRALSVREPNAAASFKSSRTAGKTSPSRKDNPASPWGVFRLKEEGWKPLGPPGGGKGVGISAVMKSSSTATSKKQKRLTVSGSSRPSSRENDQNKENPASVTMAKGKQTSTTVGGKRPSTAGAKFGDVFGVEHSHAPLSKPGRFAHVHGSNPASRPSSAHGMAPKKRSPLMGVR